MASRSQPVARTAQVLFELEQFEVVDGERCEVRGRWLGIRGRRFLRPALTVTVDGRSRRLLADLADKPWAAEEGGPWHASFPCELGGSELASAELTVAPDLTVALQSRRPTRSQPAPAAAPTAAAPQLAVQSEARATPSPFERRARADAGEQLRRELVDARAEQRRLQSQVDHLRVEQADTAQQIEELIAQADELKLELEAGARARERLAAELIEARAELDRLATARDEALLQLDTITAQRDAARYDYTEVVRKLRAMEAARQRAVAERGRALAGPDTPRTPRTGPSAAIRSHWWSR